MQLTLLICKNSLHIHPICLCAHLLSVENPRKCTYKYLFSSQLASWPMCVPVVHRCMQAEPPVQHQTYGIFLEWLDSWTGGTSGQSRHNWKELFNFAPLSFDLPSCSCFSLSGAVLVSLCAISAGLFELEELGFSYNFKARSSDSKETHNCSTQGMRHPVLRIVRK